MKTTDEILALLDAQHTAFTAFAAQMKDDNQDTHARLRELEQKGNRRGGEGPSGARTMGSVVANSDTLKNFRANRLQGSIRIPVENVITTSGLVAPQQQADPVPLPRRRLTVRELLASGRTSSNLVTYTRMVSRTNNAAVVSETAEKPQSDLTFELAEAPVRTIATWIPVSRQAMDDADQLQSTIDTELRWMIGMAEETEILFGSGVGEHLEGLSTTATPYDPPFSISGATMLDTILLAIAQAQLSLVPASGVILNDLDWAKMQSLKDGENRYIGNGPFGTVGNTLWQVPIVATPAMPQDEFMVGGFAVAAQLIDRMQTEVLISSEDRDNFIKNMLTVRAEERVALAVKMPTAIVYGDFGIVT